MSSKETEIKDVIRDYEVIKHKVSYDDMDEIRLAVRRGSGSHPSDYEMVRAIDAMRDFAMNDMISDSSIKDAKLLVFAEETARKSRTGISFDWVPAVMGAPGGFRAMRRAMIGEPAKTLRGAIKKLSTEIEGKGHRPCPHFHHSARRLNARWNNVKPQRQTLNQMSKTFRLMVMQQAPIAACAPVAQRNTSAPNAATFARNVLHICSM